MSLRLHLVFAIVSILARSLAAETIPQQLPTAGQLQASPGAIAPAAAVNAPTTGDLDQSIAGCLLLTNQSEIALAEFALDRVDHKDVKAFAQMLMKQHEDAVAKLQRVAPQQAQAALQLRDKNPEAPGQSMPADLALSGIANQLFDLETQVAKEHLRIAKSQLDQQKGPEFDEAFISAQIGCHIAALAKLRGSEQFASPQLRPLIQESTQMVEHHLEQAKELCKQLREHNADNARQASNARAPR